MRRGDKSGAFIPDKDIIMTNDFSAFYPASPVPVTVDSLLLESFKPYVRFVIGGDYNFSNSSYLNFQYMHGFINERGEGNLNDYFFVRYEKKFFNEKLRVAPIGGGFIVTDWNKIKDNYTLLFVPEVAYQATDNIEMSLSAAIIEGKGSGVFGNLNDYDMLMFKLKYSF